MNYLICATSTIFSYFQTKHMCEDNMREILVMSYVNFIVSMCVLLIMIFKKPIKVVKHDDLT